MPLRLQKYINLNRRPEPIPPPEQISLPEPTRLPEPIPDKVLFPQLHHDDISNNDNRPIVLFVIQKRGHGLTEKSFCGIGIRGKLTSDILKDSKEYNFVSCFVDTLAEFKVLVKKFSPKIIIYNYSPVSTEWMNTCEFSVMFPHIIHVVINYDMTQKLVDQTTSTNKFNYIITDDDTLQPNDHVFVVARSIPLPTKSYSNNNNNNLPIIGFQGFSARHKGIHRIAKQVIEEFDKAIIRLHIPFSLYGDPHGIRTQECVDEIKRILRNSKIQLEVSHDFKTDEEIVAWLGENDVNCYFYDYLDGCGIASSPDYAIASRKPIAITRSHQFRHMWNLSPSICIEENTLKKIIKNGITPLEPLYEKYTHENVINNYNMICDILYNKHFKTTKFIMINSVPRTCGVYDYALRIRNILQKQLVFGYKEIDTEQDYWNLIQNDNFTYKIVILNYHPSVFPWYKMEMEQKGLTYYYLYHDYTLLDIQPQFILNNDPTATIGVPLPRPLYLDGKECSIQDDVYQPNLKCPKIGSFGFGKSFERIVQIVQEEFDNAIIDLRLPYAYYSKDNGNRMNQIKQMCRNMLVKKNIKLNISHEYVEPEDIISFLQSNDLNIFVYDFLGKSGCSSVLDYALCVNRPIAISDSYMFRHIFHPSICVYQHSLKEIMLNGTDYVKELRAKWHHQSLIDLFSNLSC
jgi:hypothetical protein